MTIKYGKLIVGFNVVDSAPEPEVREKQPPMTLDEVRHKAFSRKEEVELKPKVERPKKSSQYMIDMLNPDL
jgi:hypothetical protein